MAVEIRDGYEQTDFERVHSWLTTAYWSKGVTLEKVFRAAQNSSLVVNAWEGDVQVGYCRIVSDKATFAWVCDVWVDEGHRGKGIARQMVGWAMGHSEHQNLRRWLLATADAHGVYAALGFEPLPNPERWMVKGLPIVPA